MTVRWVRVQLDDKGILTIQGNTTVSDQVALLEGGKFQVLRSVMGEAPKTAAAPVVTAPGEEPVPGSITRSPIPGFAPRRADA